VTQTPVQATTAEGGQAKGGRTASVAVAGAVLGAVAVLAVALDQWTKHLVTTNLADGSAVRLLGGALYLDLTRNPGAAFSMGTSVTFIFPLIAIGISVFIIWLSRSLRSWPWAIGLGLVLGGALGNLVDRLFRDPGPFRGHVVDFISVFGPYGDKFPIFNVADSCLSVGVVIVIALELLGFRRDGFRATKADREGD
jgi:signal peptidase II